MTVTRPFHVYDATKEWLNSKIQTDSSQFKFTASRIIESTNDLAKNEAFSKSIPGEKIYLADIQTKGRGRGANAWIAPPSGDALLMTWSWELENAAQPITAPLMGLHIYRALNQTFSNAGLSLKPPNDIYFLNNKILGILAEALQQGPRHRLIVGFGLNVFSAPSGVPIAGCLSALEQKNSGPDRNENEQYLTAPIWLKFLDDLTTELRTAVKKSQLNEMPQKDCEDLLAAIRRHPAGLRYTRVFPNGDLETVQNDMLSWRNL